jgi:hypothetical protein
MKKILILLLSILVTAHTNTYANSLDVWEPLSVTEKITKEDSRHVMTVFFFGAAGASVLGVYAFSRKAALLQREGEYYRDLALVATSYQDYFMFSDHGNRLQEKAKIQQNFATLFTILCGAFVVSGTLSYVNNVRIDADRDTLKVLLLTEF